MMRRNGGWDIRIKNKGGNWLDEFGNTAQGKAPSHNIEIFPR